MTETVPTKDFILIKAEWSSQCVVTSSWWRTRADIHAWSSKFTFFKVFICVKTGQWEWKLVLFWWTGLETCAFASIISSEAAPEVGSWWKDAPWREPLTSQAWRAAPQTAQLQIYKHRPSSCKSVSLSPAHTFHNNINTIKRLSQRSCYNFGTVTQAFVWFLLWNVCLFKVEIPTSVMWTNTENENQMLNGNTIKLKNVMVMW